MLRMGAGGRRRVAAAGAHGHTWSPAAATPKLPLPNSAVRSTYPHPHSPPLVSLRAYLCPATGTDETLMLLSAVFFSSGRHGLF